MATYPDPPPPEQQAYSSLYPTNPGAQQMLDPRQNGLQYSQLTQPTFPKIETLGQEGEHSYQQAQQHQQQAQQAQQFQQMQPTPQPPPSSFAPAMQAQPQGASEQAARGNRLRKACDSCSIRKVKCDEAGPPCRACTALDIPCTFERPSRRRGPPNRHAEALKRRRLHGGSLAGGDISADSSPSSPTHAAQALAALSSHRSNQLGLSAESVCDLETLDLLINDFFTYIHPLCPFPHEPSFREAWKRREDFSNNSFLALLASMIGALVASFPRKLRLHLKAQRREHQFPSHMSLVKRCQEVCAAARGPGYLDKDDLSVYDACTSYFLAVTGIYTFRRRQGHLYFGECLTIIRALGLHKKYDRSHTQLRKLPSAVGSFELENHASDDEPLDNITHEIGRRIFWTMFVTVKTIQQLGASFGELVIPPATPTEPYPPLPAEVDDFCIYSTHTETQPPGLLPMIAGFNANVRVYSSYNALANTEMAWGMDAIVDWERQKKLLRESLRECKQSIGDLPDDLVVWPSVGPFGEATHPNQQNGNGLHVGFQEFSSSRDPAQSLMSPSMQSANMDSSPEGRRRMQYQIQKANIHASSLSTRSYIVEKYWKLCEAHSRLGSRQSSGPLPNSPGMGITAAGIDGMLPTAPTNAYDMTEHEMRDERESIVKDLLVVLGSINQVNMERNGDSFARKIRSIASTLFHAPDQRKGQLALQAQEYLVAFLDVLVKLERVGLASSEPDEAEDEDAELRLWADLRDHQMKFAQRGGVLGFA